MVCASGVMTIFLGLRIPEHFAVEWAFWPGVQDPGTHTWKTSSVTPIGEVVVEPAAPKMACGCDVVACLVEPPLVVCVQASQVVRFGPFGIKARRQQPRAQAALHTTEMVTRMRVTITHSSIMGLAFESHLPSAEPAVGKGNKAGTWPFTGQLSDWPTMAEA